MEGEREVGGLLERLYVCLESTGGVRGAGSYPSAYRSSPKLGIGLVSWVAYALVVYFSLTHCLHSVNRNCRNWALLAS